MNGTAEISASVAVLTAAFLVGGSAITLIGSLGLLRLATFFQRIHAPTLGTTLGTACVATASMIYFSALATRPILHEVLILVFVTITTPITLMILVRAALFRERSENDARFRGAWENER